MIAVLVVFLALSSCSTTDKGAIQDFRTGSEGIAISFLDIQKNYVVDKEDQNAFFSLEVENKGTYPQEGAPAGVIWLSGFDKEILSFSPAEQRIDPGSPLIGRTPYSQKGGNDVFDFDGMINGNALTVEEYDPTILANICYGYQTKAAPQVCINSDPYDPARKNDVCIPGDIILKDQGAPIAITKIEQVVTSDEFRYIMTVKNLGKGEVSISESDCREGGQRFEFQKVRIDQAAIGGSPLSCEAKDGEVRLIDGSGTVICSIKKSSLERPSSYLTPLEISFSYTYRDTASVPITIKKYKK